MTDQPLPPEEGVDSADIESEPDEEPDVTEEEEEDQTLA